jgi:hypothetical protein
MEEKGIPHLDIIEKTFTHQMVLEKKNSHIEQQKLVELRKSCLHWRSIWNQQVPILFSNPSRDEWSKFSDWFLTSMAQLELYQREIDWKEDVDYYPEINHITRKFKKTYDAGLFAKSTWRKYRVWFLFPIQVQKRNDGAVQKKSHPKNYNTNNLIAIIRPIIQDYIENLLDFSSNLSDFLQQTIPNELIDPIDRITDMVSLMKRD